MEKEKKYNGFSIYYENCNFLFYFRDLWQNVTMKIRWISLFQCFFGSFSNIIYLLGCFQLISLEHSTRYSYNILSTKHEILIGSLRQESFLSGLLVLLPSGWLAKLISTWNWRNTDEENDDGLMSLYLLILFAISYAESRP